MSTTVAADAQPPPASSTTRAGRLRRLSQLRTYTQNHLIPSSSTSPSSPSSPTSPQRRHRNSLSRVVALSSPFHFSTTAAAPSAPSAPETTGSEPPAGEPSSSDANSSNSELPDQTQSSASSRSMPSPETQQPDATGRRNNKVASGSANGRQTGTTSASGSALMSDTDSTPSKPKMSNTIRFFPYQDPHSSSHPSLQFSPMSRTLPSEASIIRVGRYSERDGVPLAHPTEPSDAPIGFKSKVVSRKHCEFSFANGQWHLKDVGSSSGTFLNRIRLSPPNMVSRLYAVRDGDIVQLGMDFRGGEEMIFRCVRIRIECNRMWQQRPNEFNKNTESLINNLGKGKAAEDFSGCRECSICLGSVLRPYQCLFMAACAHVWHYKCISRLIHTRDYPMFQCPNCRVWTDLTAEVDDPVELEEESQQEGQTDSEPTTSQENVNGKTPLQADSAAEEQPKNSTQTNGVGREANDLAAMAENLDLEDRKTPMQDAENPDGRDDTDSRAESTEDGSSAHESRSANIPIPARASPRTRHSGSHSYTPADAETFEDNPMTPRNDSGPLALDGRAGRF